jgi:hypothetical protein
MCRFSWNLGASASWNPQVLSRPGMGLLYLAFRNMTSKPSCPKENITSVLSVRLSGWDRARSTGNILMKFHIWNFDKHLLTKICPRLTKYLAVIGLWMYLKAFLFYKSWKLTLKTHLTIPKANNSADFSYSHFLSYLDRYEISIITDSKSVAKIKRNFTVCFWWNAERTTQTLV